MQKKVVKVELSNLSDIKGAMTILKGLEPEATKVIQKFEQKFEAYYDEYDNVIKMRNSMYDYVMRDAAEIKKTFASNAKELGINPEDVAEYKEFDKMLEYAELLIKAIDRDYKRPKW
jgi:thiamine pyrophosphate-dependent acetolactate synthase large subunit-like protein